MWPALWLMGNLARATYVNSTERMWPFCAAHVCDDRNRASQEINACNAPLGRGAPEIDMMEVMYISQINASMLSASLQVAPGLEHDRPLLGHKPNQTWYQPVFGEGITINEYFYGVHQTHLHPTYEYQTDTISFNYWLDDTFWTEQHLFRVEWEPPLEDGTGGYIYWFIDGKLIAGIHGEELQRVSQTEIPSEPLYLLMNVAVSKDWSFPDAWFLNCPHKCWTCFDPQCTCALPEGYCETFPTQFELDYVRVYQAPNDPRHVLGCSPPARSTADFIEAHKDRYTIRTQTKPLLPIAKGGAPCTNDDQCGQGTCRTIAPSHTRTTTMLSTTMNCVCHAGWTGPTCLAHSGSDPVTAGNRVFWLWGMLAVVVSFLLYITWTRRSAQRALYESLSDVEPDNNTKPKRVYCCKAFLWKACLVATMCQSASASVAPLHVAHQGVSSSSSSSSYNRQSRVITAGTHPYRGVHMIWPTSRRSLAVFTSRPFLIPSAHASTKQARKGDFPSVDEAAEEYAQLGLVGKIVAGTIEITLATLLEYISGYVGGYALGTLTGLPAFLTKPVTDPADATRHFWAQVSHRAGRMHGKSNRWARSWAGISAAFGGFRVATRVLRDGKEDEWSTVFSSMAAGAYFARKEGPKAMVRGAVVYGGIMYLLSGNLMEKKEPFQYQEEPVDF